MLVKNEYEAYRSDFRSKCGGVIAGGAVGAAVGGREGWIIWVLERAIGVIGSVVGFLVGVLS